jgi:hypothetical protein
MAEDLIARAHATITEVGDYDAAALLRLDPDLPHTWCVPIDRQRDKGSK